MERFASQIFIEDARPIYTQIKYNLDDFGITLDQIQSWQLKLYEENEEEQKELFDKYLKDPKDMMKLFENAIVKDFHEKELFYQKMKHIVIDNLEQR